MSANEQQSVVIGVEERVPLSRLVPLGLQHVFAMFGATILVPILTGLNPAVALFTSGLGTLTFILVTGGKVPAYLGSSFAFIAPVAFIVAQEQWGIPYAMGGVIVSGLVYVAVAAVISVTGVKWLQRLLPPVVVGPVIMVIGLGLAPAALDMTGMTAPDATIADPGVMVALLTLAFAVGASLMTRGFMSTIPVLVAVVGGYLVSVLLGLVDFTPVREAAWFGVPQFTAPRFDWSAIMVIAPVAIVTMAEHLGDVFVLSTITGRNFYEKPGLHRTLLGDGLASALAGLFGGPPNTTYGENVGVMAITRVFSVRVIAFAATLALGMSFVPKLGALIQSIPTPVMGGVAMVLFGVIAASGVRTLVESRLDFSHKRNLIIPSVILVVGIGGAVLQLGPFQLQGMALAAVVGVVLNLVLPRSASAGEAEGAATAVAKS
ncbi:MAG: uracil permease [Bacillota bacterium]|nr:MAG: uracil permease [Bacillota bacterium]